MFDDIDRTRLPSWLSLRGVGLNVAAVAALVVVAGLSALLIPGDSVKYCIGFAGMGIVAFVALGQQVRVQTLILLLAITFPVILPFAGKDAVTTGTLVVLLCLTLNTVSTRAIWTKDDRLVVALLLGIIMFAAIGAISGGGAMYWGPELRQWIALVGGVASFLLVVGWTRAAGAEAGRVIEDVIAVLVFVLALHVVLSLAMQRWPAMAHYLTVFQYTGQQSFADVAEGQYTRAATVFTGGEEFGELLLLVFPFSMYKLFRSSLAIYLPLTLLLLVGVIATATRSAILLVSLEVVLFGLVLLSRRISRARLMVVLGLAVVTIAVFSPLFVSATQASLQRLDQSAAALQSGSGLSAALNRSLVWPNAVTVVSEHLSLFGHGPVQAYVLHIGGPYNFHSLYLTLIFQFGVVGAAVWLVLFAQLGVRLTSALRRIRFRADPVALLLTACLISLFCFLLNEIKFEFNRDDSVQQLVWLVLGLMYSCASVVKSARTAEGTLEQ